MRGIYVVAYVCMSKDRNPFLSHLIQRVFFVSVGEGWGRVKRGWGIASEVSYQSSISKQNTSMKPKLKSSQTVLQLTKRERSESHLTLRDKEHETRTKSATPGDPVNSNMRCKTSPRSTRWTCCPDSDVSQRSNRAPCETPKRGS